MQGVNWISSLRRSRKYLIRGVVLWSVFWYFCRPPVVLHYEAGAAEPVTYFYNDNHWIDKTSIYPGTTERYFADMFPASDSWINVSLPFSSRDDVDLTPPFSRVDIYITADGRIGRTIIRQGFFDRFSAP